MAKNTLKAVISAFITLVLFVGIPYMLPEYLPDYVMENVAFSEFDILGFLNQIMLIGGVTAAFTLVRGFVEPSSIISFIISIAQNISTIIFTGVFLGAGNITRMGITELTVEMEGLTSVIKTDLRAFFYFTLLTVGLRLIKTYLEWKEARIETAPPGRIPA